MKNRVLRSTLVVILVIAMVLTMAACGEKTPVETEKPVVTQAPATEKPVEKTDAPVTTEAPKTEKPADTVADDFGISLEPFDGTYGTNLADIASAGAFVLKIDAAKTKDAKFDVYLGDYTAGGSNTLLTAASVQSAIASLVEYDGDDVSDAAAAADTNGNIVISFSKAGTYEVSIDVTIVENSAQYGAWNVADDDRATYETTLEATATVAKKVVEIKADPIVIPESTSELKLTAGTFANFDNTTYAAVAGEVTNTITLSYELNYTKTTAVGTYAVAVKAMDGTDEIDLEDITFKNHIVTLADTSIIVVSAYDWNEIRDVVTSIDEIQNTSGAFDGNYKIQLPLAKARYEALSAEQLAFFKTGLVADVQPSTAVAYLTEVSDWEATLTGDKNLEGNASEGVALKASTYVAYMEAAEKAAADAAVIAAFVKTAKDAKLPTSGFNTGNTAHVAAFNTVDAYFTGLTTAEQTIISTDSGTEYDAYAEAKTAMSLVEIDAVKELIVGAYQAYTKALENGTKVIYQYDNLSDTIATEWAYINSAEVKSLTSQAKAAFDALTETQQKYLAASYKTGATEASTGVDAKFENVVKVANGPSGDVTFIAATSSDGATNTYKNALDKLVAMNAMVDEMLAITTYVNVEDYSGVSIAYERLNTLIYGKKSDGTSETMFAGGYETTPSDDPQTRFAMDDMIKAPARNYDAIVAQYQEWIDFIIAVEDYKAGLVETFKNEVTTYFADNAEDYTSKVASIAIVFDKNDALTIINAIMGETTLSTTTAVSNVSTSKTFETGVIVAVDAAKFLDEVENVEEVSETIEDCFDIDSIIDTYIDSFIALA